MLDPSNYVANTTIYPTDTMHACTQQQVPLKNFRPIHATSNSIMVSQNLAALQHIQTSQINAINSNS